MVASSVDLRHAFLRRYCRSLAVNLPESFTAASMGRLMIVLSMSQSDCATSCMAAISDNLGLSH